MIRPFTCVCLVLAAGSGLYLYQVKQRAFALDAELSTTFHDIDLARERTRMLRADWALMNDPERLQALASHYLQLEPMAPSQLMTMDQLAAALPPPVPPGAAAPSATPDAGKPAPAPDPTQDVPMAEAAPMVPHHTHPVTPEVALLPPAVPAADVPAPEAPPPVAAPPPPSFAAAAPAPIFAAPSSAAPSFAPPPPDAPVAIAIPPLPKPAHHWVKHPAPAPQTHPWLASATGSPAEKPRRTRHHAAPEPAPGQFYAANEPARLPEPAPRITPPAATVMYSAGVYSAGSSLGMAASATLAPPRPLYSTSQ